MTKHMDLDTEKPRKKGFMYPTQTDGNTGFGEREREIPFLAEKEVL